MENVKAVKSMYIFLTICFMIVGGILMIYPQTGLDIICKIFGIFLSVYGMTKIIGYFTRDLFQLAFQFDFGLGLIAMILGCVLIARTDDMIEFLSICMGVFMFVDAALKIQTAIDAKKFGIAKWWLILVVAIAVAVVGVLLLIVPFKTAVMVTRLVGLSLCIDGILNLIVVLCTVKIIKHENNIIDMDEQ